MCMKLTIISFLRILASSREALRARHLWLKHQGKIKPDLRGLLNQSGENIGVYCSSLEDDEIRELLL